MSSKKKSERSSEPFPEEGGGKGEPPAGPPTSPPPAESEMSAGPALPPAVDYKDLYLRALAELDNFRKVAARDRRALLESASESLIRKLLDPVDALDRAVSEVERLEAQAPGELRPALARSGEGLRALRRQFLAVFESEGVTRIWQPGARFDPTIHEAVDSIPTDAAEEGTVVEVVQPGYLLRERLVRPARVAVAAPKPPAAPSGEAGTALQSPPHERRPNHDSHSTNTEA